MKELLYAYWFFTTAYGLYWLIKNPSPGKDQEYFTAAELVGLLLPIALLAWALVPMMLLWSIKFKRWL